MKISKIMLSALLGVCVCFVGLNTVSASNMGDNEYLPNKVDPGTGGGGSVLVGMMIIRLNQTLNLV